jgi:hypothetical protein
MKLGKRERLLRKLALFRANERAERIAAVDYDAAGRPRSVWDSGPRPVSSRQWGFTRGVKSGKVRVIT